MNESSIQCYLCGVNSSVIIESNPNALLIQNLHVTARLSKYLMHPINTLRILNHDREFPLIKKPLPIQAEISSV